MKIPQDSKDLGDFAVELSEACNVSVARRVNDCILWRSYMLDGAPPGKQALFNKTGTHIDAMASQLFSPSEIRFWLERSRHADQAVEPILEEASNILTDHFRDDRVGLAVSQALPWALAFGKSFVKLSWDKERIKPYVVMPYEIGVYREDYECLDDQEAICQTFYLTYQEFCRRIKGHAKEKQIKDKVEGKMGSTSVDDGQSGYHRIFMGGTQPIITQGVPQPAGFSSLRPNAPTAEISPEVAKEIVKMQELWVWDDDREDWTTLQFVAGGIMVEGELQHRNLFIPGHLPFSEICASPINGNFWGLSEIAPVRKLQDALNDRIADVLYLQELQIRRPKAFIGFDSLTEEKMAAIKKPGGYINENNFQAKIEDLAPKIDGDVEQSIKMLTEMFDEIAGITPALAGKAQGSVRSHGHAETNVRMSSARLRDKALLVEHQVAELGDLAFELLKAKVAKIQSAADKTEFYLSTIEDDQYTVTVDAHSSSPVFVAESIELAEVLKKEGAIDAEDFLRLTHPPLFTTLLSRLRQREAAQQKLIAEHPELAVEGGKKSHHK